MLNYLGRAFCIHLIVNGIALVIARINNNFALMSSCAVILYLFFSFVFMKPKCRTSYIAIIIFFLVIFVGGIIGIQNEGNEYLDYLILIMLANYVFSYLFNFLRSLYESGIGDFLYVFAYAGVPAILILCGMGARSFIEKRFLLLKK